MSDTAQPSFKDKMMKILGKFSGSRFVRAIMGAGYSIIAFSIIGSMFLVLTVLTQVITAKGFVDFYNNTFGRFNNIYTVIYNATMGIIAIYFAGSFAYNYADIYRKEENLLLDPLNAVFLTLMGLFITVPQLVWKGGNTVFVNILKKDNVIAGGYGVSGSGLTRIGATGIFTGLIVAWLTVQIYRFCIKHNWRIKMPASVPSGVANSFTALIPGFVIAIVIALIDVILIVLGTDIFQLLFIPGGSGATLGMALWMAFASRSKQLRELGKLEAVPAVFNINEPLLFGLPIVYNVRLFVPFLLAPMTCSMVAYAAIATHLVPKIIVQQPWPIPVGIGGMMATASWQGAVLALVNAIVAFLIWYPFIKHYDNELLKKEQAGAEKA